MDKTYVEGQKMQPIAERLIVERSYLVTAMLDKMRNEIDADEPRASGHQNAFHFHPLFRL
jgi:hypothetical protein